MALMDLYKKYMYGTSGMGEPTQGLFGTGGEKSGGLIDFNKMNNQQGGLLQNIPQTALLGSALFGQGMQGKDPFSALLPAVTQTAQLQKLMTPKDLRTQLQKNLEAAGLKKGTPEYNQALMQNVNPVKDLRTPMGKNLEDAGFVKGTPEYQEAMKLRTLPEGTVGFSSFQKKANVDNANISGDYAVGGIDLVTDIANLGARSPGTFGLKGKVLGFTKDLSTEVEGIYSGTTKAAADRGGISSGAYEFLGNQDYSGIQPLQNALAIHVARNRNPTGRLLKDMISTAKDDSKLQGLGGAAKVSQRLPFIFKEFLDTARSNFKAAGKSEEEVAEILNPKIKEFNEALNKLNGASKQTGQVPPSFKKMSFDKKKGIWVFN